MQVFKMSRPRTWRTAVFSGELNYASLEVILELNTNHVTVVVVFSFDGGSHLAEFVGSAFGHEQVGIAKVKLPVFGFVTST